MPNKKSSLSIKKSSAKNRASSTISSIGMGFRAKIVILLSFLLFATVGTVMLERSNAASGTLTVRSRDTNTNQVVASGSKFDLYEATGFSGLGYTYRLVGSYQTPASVRVTSGKNYQLRFVSAPSGYTIDRWDNNNATGTFTVGYGRSNGVPTVGFRGADAGGQELTMRMKTTQSSPTPPRPKPTPSPTPPKSPVLKPTPPKKR